MKSCWNSRLSELLRVGTFLAAVVCAVHLTAFAQFSPPEKTAGGGGDDSYLFPIGPGIPNTLSGTMGELRATHFHAGIDIRTNNMVGLPVVAVQDGFVSRVVMSSFGYGKVIYLTHTDGMTSVYAHLDGIKGKLGEYVRQEQYTARSFEKDIQFKPGQFRVKRGDTIAISGNTGSSNGPHLHFEIRDPQNRAINPLRMGFKEISDDLAPIVQKVALRTLSIHSRVNDRFGRHEFYVVRKSSNEYVLPAPIFAHGRIGLELLAYDKLVKDHYRCGINYIEVWADSQRVFNQKIEEVDFENTRDIVALMDFKTMVTRGNRFNKLYIADGNRLPYYDPQLGNGEIVMKDRDIPVRIRLTDSFGNRTTVSLTLRPDQPVKEVPLLEAMKKEIEYDLIDNTLMVAQKPCGNQNALKVFTRQGQFEITPTYYNQNRWVYLINLQQHLPDSVSGCGGSVELLLRDRVPSGSSYDYYSDKVDIHFPERALYDTVFLKVDHRLAGGREIFTVGTRTTPLKRSARVLLKAEVPGTDREKYAVYRVQGNGLDYEGGTWLGNGIQFFTRELGDFTIARDDLKPVIFKISISNSSARVRIRDRQSGIAKYEATLNGEWLLMNYDYKTGILQSERLDRSKPLKGDFVLTVTDNAGNVATYQQRIP